MTKFGRTKKKNPRMRELHGLTSWEGGLETPKPKNFKTVENWDELRLNLNEPPAMEVDGVHILTNEPQHEIRLEGRVRGEDFTAVCTCGEWRFGPSSMILDIGREAKKHSEATGHKLRGVG